MYSRYTILSMHLHELMKTFDVTCESLGNAIGVSKQTVSNLSTRKSRITKEHYLAIRLYFDHLVNTLDASTDNDLKMYAYTLAFGSVPLSEELAHIFRFADI